MIRSVAAIGALVLVPAAAAGSSRPVVALTASPAHVQLVGADRRAIRVANPGSEPVVVDVATAGVSFSARGRPRISRAGAEGRRDVSSWLVARPNRIALAAGASAELGLVSSPPRSAEAGDHAALILLTTRAAGAAEVGVRMRVGVTVLVRVPGTIRRLLAVRSLRVRGLGRRRVLELVVVNAGNVVERLRRGRLTVSLFAGRKRLAELRPPPRELLPGTSGIFELGYRYRLRGPVRALVALGPGKHVVRSFRLRL